MRPLRCWGLVLCVALAGACAACQAAGPHVTPSPWPGVTTLPQAATAGTPVTAAATAGAPATAAPTASAPATAAPTSTPAAPDTPAEPGDTMTLTIVYDNVPWDERLQTAWGFACLVETGQAVLLFDTGGDGPTLMNNMALLGIDPRRIERVVLSHNHGDHTGGLDALLNVDGRKVVYVPRSFPAAFKARLGERADVVEVDQPATITDRVRTTGELGTSIIEQALVLETGQGLIVLTGCAHPGIVNIVRQAKTWGEVYMVVGGLHLNDKSARQVEAIIAELKQLGVQKVAPTHCTGQAAIQLFKAEFGPGFIPAGAGAVIRQATGPE